MAGVMGRLRQASDFPNQFFAAQSPRCVQILAYDQLSKRRPASYSRNAALSAKANVGDAFFFQLCLLQSNAEFQDVSTSRVFQLHGRIGIFNFTGVAWILEMVEEFGGIHRLIVMLR